MAGSPKRLINRLAAAAEKYLQAGDKVNYELYRAQAKWVREKYQANCNGETISKWAKTHPEPFKLAGLKDKSEDYSKSLEKIEDEFGLPSGKHYQETEVSYEADSEGSRLVTGRHLKDKNTGHVYNNTAIEKPIHISHTDLKLMAEIETAKEKLRTQASQDKTPDELKTIYKLMKKLDADYKRVRFNYYFNEFDEYLFQDIQDRSATPPFHLEMFRVFQSSRRACVVCPRGHAKSTNARKYLVHQIANKKCNYIVIVGSSEEMAAQNLRWVRDQFTDNPRVIDTYGYLKNPDKWAETEFEVVFRNAQGEPIWRCKVAAKGAGQRIRGANEKGRPDFFYIDDLEEEEQVMSKDRRDKLRHWFQNTLLPSGSKNARIVVTGTILHMDSLLVGIAHNKVRDHIDWDVLFYSAIFKDEDGVDRALWPGHHPLEKLLAIQRVNPIGFATEYQNNPRAGMLSVFNRDDFKYFEESQLTKNGRGQWFMDGRPLNLMMTTDFAYSQSASADYTVYMITGMDIYSQLYVLEYYRFREPDPLAQIDAFFEMVTRWGIDYVVMEDINYQHVIKRFIDLEMQARKIMLHIHEIKRSNVVKFLRIKGLQNPVRKGMIFWRETDHELEEEMNQVTASSLGAHDDVIDCLADAWTVQIESYEERKEVEVRVNTMEWLIQKGVWDETGAVA